MLHNSFLRKITCNEFLYETPCERCVKTEEYFLKRILWILFYFLSLFIYIPVVGPSAAPTFPYPIHLPPCLWEISFPHQASLFSRDSNLLRITHNFLPLRPDQAHLCYICARSLELIPDILVGGSVLRAPGLLETAVLPMGYSPLQLLQSLP